MTIKDVINEIIESETLKKYFIENLETYDTRLKEIQNMLDSSIELGDALWDFCFETDSRGKGLPYETMRQGLVKLKENMT